MYTTVPKFASLMGTKFTKPAIPNSKNEVSSTPYVRKEKKNKSELAKTNLNLQISQYS